MDELHRAVLVTRATSTPLDPKWRPHLRPDELEAANARITHLPFRWQWADANPVQEGL